LNRHRHELLATEEVELATVRTPFRVARLTCRDSSARPRTGKRLNINLVDAAVVGIERDEPAIGGERRPRLAEGTGDEGCGLAVGVDPDVRVAANRCLGEEE
jgi:hypothetical protein